jgi:TRAP-type C4-dicarboxylate transport system permease small subunit
MARLIDAWCRGLEVAIALALAAMVVMVFGNVVLRYAFDSGIAVSEELSRWLFVWLTFMGAIVALKEHAHLGSDLVVSRLPVAGRRACLVVGQLLMLYLTWLLLRGSWEQTVINWGTEAPVTGLPQGIVYAAGVVFAACTGVLLLRELWRALTGRTSEAELVMVRESEEAAEAEALLAKQAGAERDEATGRSPGSKAADRGPGSPR